MEALPQARGVRFGEETITDLLMLDLNRRELRRTLFVQTSKPKEAAQGTDFEWWLGSDATGWIRFAVQAKKLDLKSERYLNLKHTVNGVLQIDLLEQYAELNKALPVYCLYNYSQNVDQSKHWHCCQRSFQEKELGCTLTPSSNVNESIHTWGAKNFDFVHRFEDTIPWRCLASCPQVRDVFRQPLAELRSGLRRASSPLFGAYPFIYEQLPFMLRVQALDDTPRYRGVIPWNDELDPELYDQRAGRPRRISALDFNPRA